LWRFDSLSGETSAGLLLLLVSTGSLASAAALLWELLLVAMVDSASMVSCARRPESGLKIPGAALLPTHHDPRSEWNQESL